MIHIGYRSTLKMIVLSIVMLLSMPTHAIDDLESVSLKLKWRHQFQFAGYYAAVEKGFYADAGFDVTLLEHQGAGDLFEPVINGDVEFGLADSSIVVKRLQGAPVVVVTTVFQHSPLVMLSLKDSGILSPFEFIGKRVMFQRGADDASIQAMLTTLGILPSEYELVEHNFDNFALLDDSADVDAMSAYASNQPFLYQERGYDVQVIDPANYGIDFYGDLLYTSETYLRNNPEKVTAFKSATLKGWAYALENPDEVIGWLLDKYPSGKTEAALRYEADVIARMVSVNFVSLGTIYNERFERISEIYKRLKLAPENGQLDGLVLDDYLQSNDVWSSMVVRWIVGMTIVLAIGLVVLLVVAASLRRTVQRRTQQLHNLNSMLSRQIDLTDHYVIFAELDTHDRFTKVSQALCRVTGYSRDELMQTDPVSLVPEKAREGRRAMARDVLQGNSWEGELKQFKKDGTQFWVYMYVDPLYDDQGTVIGYTATANDITEKKKIEQLSQTDQLTGLANRTKLDLDISREWARYMRYHDDFSVVLVDIDHFKNINDTYGHLEGDRVLKQVSAMISKQVRSVDTVGRWGGEEFLIILTHTALDDACLVAEKIRKSLAGVENLRCEPPTASFGVASASIVTNELESLIRSADQALYRAKAQGRNQVVSFLELTA